MWNVKQKAFLSAYEPNGFRKGKKIVKKFVNGKRRENVTYFMFNDEGGFFNKKRTEALIKY